MSVLGIRNEIHDLAIRYDIRSDVDHALAKQIMGSALMTEASLADWEKKYPADSQLARDVYLLQHLYAKIDYDEARSKAKFCAQWLLTRYTQTWYAKNMRTAMGPSQPAAKATPQPSASGGEWTGAPLEGTSPPTGPTGKPAGSQAPIQGAPPAGAAPPSGTLEAAPSGTSAPPSGIVEPAPVPRAT